MGNKRDFWGIKEMPKVVITGNTTKVTAARFGNDIVLRKKIVDAKLTETHRAAPNKRVNGKQKDTEVLTLSAADQKALRTADQAALASAKIEHAREQRTLRTANQAELAAAKAEHAKKMDAYIEWGRVSQDAEVAKAIEKAKQKPMTAEAKKETMARNTTAEKSAQTHVNDVQKKAKAKIKELRTIIRDAKPRKKTDGITRRLAKGATQMVMNPETEKIKEKYKTPPTKKKSGRELNFLK